jgi:hypothetical protein
MNVPKELLCQLRPKEAQPGSTISPSTRTLPSTLPVCMSWVNSDGFSSWQIGQQTFHTVPRALITRGCL